MFKGDDLIHPYMSTSRSPGRPRIRDFGTRRIQNLGDRETDTRGITLPLDLRDTEFPIDIGREVGIELREPEGEVVLVPKGE